MTTAFIQGRRFDLAESPRLIGGDHWASILKLHPLTDEARQFMVDWTERSRAGESVEVGFEMNSVEGLFAGRCLFLYDVGANAVQLQGKGALRRLSHWSTEVPREHRLSHGGPSVGEMEDAVAFALRGMLPLDVAVDVRRTVSHRRVPEGTLMVEMTLGVE